METATMELRLNGLCCPNCAGKIQAEAQKLAGVSQVDILFNTQKMRLSLHPDADQDSISESVTRIVRRIEPDVRVEPLGGAAAVRAAAPSAHSHGAECACGGEHRHDHGHDHGHTEAHEHSHDHSHDHGESQSRLRLWLLGVSAVLFAVGFFLEGIPKAVVYVVSYALAGYDILWRAVRNIGSGSFFDENLLMSVASLSAVILGEYAEGVAVMLLYQLGEFFQAKAVGKSRSAIKSLLDIQPETAWLLREGQAVQVRAEEVAVGGRIQVRPGERVPLDGTVLSGTAALDTSALTGESLPRQIGVGDTAMSGCVALDGLLEIEVTRAFADTTVSRILHMVEEASEKKAPTEQFITRFSKYYTPAVVAAAALLAVIPPLFVPGAAWSDWVYRAMTFLVVSCPCALVISVPLSYFAGIGAASRAGVLVKGAGALDILCETDTLAMDKTGTLTTGTFQVSQVVPAPGKAAQALRLSAAAAEQGSNHPIARAVVRAAEGEVLLPLEEVNEISGMGVVARIDGQTYLAGNESLMQKRGVTGVLPAQGVGSVVHVAVAGEYLGYLLVADRVKDDVPHSIRELHENGIRRIVLLTGDAQEVALDVARQVGIDEVHAQLLPEQKLRLVEEMQAASSKKVGFVGDGINDAPVLAQADVGLAMGGLGADAAIEAADVVLMTDEPRTIVSALRIARRTRRIVLQNIVFALGIKAVVLVLSALGLANMWAAVFADVGVTMLAILNAMRALRAK